MGYNITVLTKIGFRFEMNSYSTQVAQLQFEYICELAKNIMSGIFYALSKHIESWNISCG
jgi:hypothetical protein